MRKSMFLACVLMGAALFFLPFAIGKVNGGKGDIRITEEVLCGDPEEAAGIVLRMPSHWGGHLLWDTEYAVGGTEKKESSFAFSSSEARWTTEPEKKLSLYFQTSPVLQEAYSGSWVLIPGNEVLQDIISMAEDNGAEERLTVRIGDYYDFYPVFMGLEGNSVYYEGLYEETCSYLTEYFHISVAEDRWEVFVEGSPEGTLGLPAEGFEIIGEEQLVIVSASAAGKDGFYFTYFLRDEKSGESVDRGQNRGIFYFPHGAGEDGIWHADLTKGRKLCELPSGVCPALVMADEEEGVLYLVSEEGNAYKLWVYRMEGEGLALAQEILFPPHSGLCRMSREEGGILLTWSDNSFSFVTREEGRHALWCDGAFPDPLEWKELPFPIENACVFDGSRLMLAAYESWDSMNVVLAVYDREGISYGGLYRHSGTGDVDAGYGIFDGVVPQGSREYSPYYLWFGGGNQKARPLEMRVEER